MSDTDRAKAISGLCEHALWRMGGIFDQISAERLRAIAKHGYSHTPEWAGMPDTGKLIILAEEFGEVARAMTYDEGCKAKLKAELIQVATMSAMWAESLDSSAVIEERGTDGPQE